MGPALRRGVKDGRIAALGSLRGRDAQITIDAAGQAPVPFAEVVNDALVLLMAAESRQTGWRITKSALPPDAGFDGAAFTADFARAGGY